MTYTLLHGHKGYMMLWRDESDPPTVREVAQRVSEVLGLKGESVSLQHQCDRYLEMHEWIPSYGGLSYCVDLAKEMKRLKNTMSPEGNKNLFEYYGFKDRQWRLYEHQYKPEGASAAAAAAAETYSPVKTAAGARPEENKNKAKKVKPKNEKMCRKCIEWGLTFNARTHTTENCDLALRQQAVEKVQRRADRRAVSRKRKSKVKNKKKCRQW